MEDSMYRLYENDVNDIKKEDEKIKEYLNIFSRFFKYSYEEKVTAMKELWGEVKDKKTFYYGNKCKITVYIDTEQVYHFEFSMDQLNINYIKKFAPELYGPFMDPYYKKRNELFQIEEKQKETEYQKQNELIINNINENVAQQNINMLDIKKSKTNQ